MKALQRTFLFAASLFLFVESGAQTSQELQQLQKDVSYLAGNDLQGREAGTKNEVKAAKYIAKRFEEMGLRPMGDNHTFYQYFTFKDETGAGAEQVKQGINVIAYIDNGGRNTIVLGAHYDHLALASGGNGKKAVCHGADDNTSGVGAILLLAQRLKLKKDAMNNYLIVAFSAHEKGLIGSGHFVKNPTVSMSKLNCMLNFDRIGRLADQNVLRISGTGTSPKWTSVLGKVEHDGIEVAKDQSGLGHSDHTSFYLQEIPVLSFSTGRKGGHVPSDDMGKIDLKGILATSNYAERLLMELDNVLKMSYAATEGSEQRASWMQLSQLDENE